MCSIHLCGEWQSRSRHCFTYCCTHLLCLLYMKLNIPILFNRSTWLLLNSPMLKSGTNTWEEDFCDTHHWFESACVHSPVLTAASRHDKNGVSLLNCSSLNNRAITRKPVKHAKEKSPLNIHHLCFCFSAALCFQITGFSQCITQGGSLRACTWLYVAFSVIFPRAGLMQQKCFSSALTR